MSKSVKNNTYLVKHHTGWKKTDMQRIQFNLKSYEIVKCVQIYTVNVMCVEKMFELRAAVKVFSLCHSTCPLINRDVVFNKLTSLEVRTGFVSDADLFTVPQRTCAALLQVSY